MCGIAGYWNFSEDRNTESLRGIISRMTNAMFLRGPDSGGIWYDSPRNLALGMRRLAVRDLSDAGMQPMRTESKRHTLVYNGEIYNAEELRAELELSGITFTGTSDTEVVLQACVQWGVEKAVKKFLGMFAFALWDRTQETLYLARDRFGVKPLYWGKLNNTFLFASELKALRASNDAEFEIDRNALAQLLRYNFIPAPFSIYKNVHKLEGGDLRRCSKRWICLHTPLLGPSRCRVGRAELTLFEVFRGYFRTVGFIAFRFRSSPSGF